MVFDAALRIECMSSEESDVDDENTMFLRTHGYAWRSTRLLRLYYTLDQEEISEKSSRPRRGIGKKDRVPGSPKEDSLLPPKDVQTWMISKRWLRATLRTHPDLLQHIDSLLIKEGAGFDWNNFDALGGETEESDEDKGSPMGSPA